jgi:multidrug efflux pump subunit AcrB
MAGRLGGSIATSPCRCAGRRRSWIFLLSVGAATWRPAFCSPGYRSNCCPSTQVAIQVVVDLPRGSSLEETERLLMAAAERLADLPELTDIQIYAGTAAPFNFNGLVRHSYLRQRSEQGDLQFNLQPKSERGRASHAIALEVRQRLADLSRPEGTAMRVVEVPPGPPVLATLLGSWMMPAPVARRRAAASIVPAGPASSSCRRQCMRRRAAALHHQYEPGSWRR